MKIVLVISSLGPGGAERVVANLANGLTRAGHQVLVATNRADKPDFYSLDPGVRRELISYEGSGRDKIENIRRCLRGFGPQWVVSHINKTNVRCVLASKGEAWGLIVTEHNDPRMQPIEPLWNWARHWLYRKASAVVGVSQGVVDFFPLVSTKKKHVIPNGVPNHSASHVGPTKFRIVAVGRLVPIKGFHRLVEAVSLLKKHVPDVSLKIWGEGPERARLQSLIDSLGLAAQVELPGLTNEPFAAMAQADVLACTSVSEGFGNVLVEAMSVGLPAVSFDCPTGPREIIEDGVNGFLVPDGNIVMLAEKLRIVLQDPALWRILSQGALRSVEARFSESVVIDRWLQLMSTGGKR